MKMSEDERAGYDVLVQKMPEDLALDVVKFRRDKKAKITARIARTLIREYEAFGDIEKAAETHMMRGWTGFESAWIKRPASFVDQNHPSPKQETPQERTKRMSLFNDYRFARDEGRTEEANKIRSQLQMFN